MDVEQRQLEDLLARCVLGDRYAFQALYDKTSPKVFGLGIRMLGDRDRAKDLVQDVYVRIWSRAGEYHPQRGRVMAWLLTIARYRAVDMIRAESRRPTDTLDGDLPGAPDLLDVSHHALEECMDTLAESQRKSILTVFFGGLTHDELANREAAPLGTVKSRIRRGLMRLRECLEA